MTLKEVDLDAVAKAAVAEEVDLDDNSPKETLDSEENSEVTKRQFLLKVCQRKQ